jgi:hypothetical protein
MNEIQFGNKVRQVLNRGLGGNAQVERRLRAARELALSRQRQPAAPAFALADNVLGRFGSWSGLALYVLMPLVLLTVSAAGIYNWQLNQRIAEVEEIDTQLLSDDLPIDAYLDRGFQNWLKKRSAEQ